MTQTEASPKRRTIRANVTGKPGSAGRGVLQDHLGTAHVGRGESCEPKVRCELDDSSPILGKVKKKGNIPYPALPESATFPKTSVFQALAASLRVYAYLRRIGLITKPERIARVLTNTRFGAPSIITETRWRFGLKVRLVTLVVLRPMPPRYLALPRMVIRLPDFVRAPVK